MSPVTNRGNSGVSSWGRSSPRRVSDCDPSVFNYRNLSTPLDPSYSVEKV